MITGNKKVPAGFYVLNIIVIKIKINYTSNPRSPWTSPDYHIKVCFLSGFYKQRLKPSFIQTLQAVFNFSSKDVYTAVSKRLM